MRPRLADLLAGLALCCLALLCFARLVARPGALIVDGRHPSLDHAQREDVRVLGNDLTYVFLPHHAQVARHVAEIGRLPLWDTAGFAGRPMVGNPQGGLFYPPVWLVWWSRSPAALGWLTVGHLIWAGLGVYVLLRSLSAGRFASTVAAGCFQASPYLLAHTFEGHYPHVWVTCWYPWAFWAFGQYRRGRPRGTLLLAPMLALMFLCGHLQEWYYLVFALSAWAVVDAFRALRARRGHAALVALAVWAGILALSLGLVAIELMPDLATQGWTLRGGRLTLARVSRYQLHALNLFQLLGPAALGGPDSYFGPDNYWETLPSIGLIPLVLVAVAVMRHPDRSVVRSWIALVVISVMFAAGRRLGLFTLLFELVPGMNRFRVPSRSLFLANLGAAVLAGLGVEALERFSDAREDWRLLERRVRRVAVVVVVCLVLGQSFAWGSKPRPLLSGPRSAAGVMSATASGTRRPKAVPASRIPCVDRAAKIAELTGGQFRGILAASRLFQSGMFWFALTVTLATLAFGRWSQGGRRVAAQALGAFALLELGLHGLVLLKVAPAEQFLGADPISGALARVEPPVAGPFRIRARDILYHDLRASWNGFEKVNINDSFQIQHAADLYKTLYPLLYVLPPSDPDEPMGEAIARFRRDVRQGVLDRLGVAFLVSDHVEPEPAWPLVASGTWQRSRFVIHRNPTALPRAYVVPRALAADDDISGVLSLFARTDPRAAVLMERDPLGPGAARQPFTPAEWASSDPDRPVIRVTTVAPGLLVVADTWMPGWTAHVDGRPAPIFRGNHAQRVVPLPDPGRHEIVLRYHAPGLARGMALTGLSAVVWTAAWVATRSKKRLHPGRPLRHHTHFRRSRSKSRASRAGSTPVRHHVKGLLT